MKPSLIFLALVAAVFCLVGVSAVEEELNESDLEKLFLAAEKLIAEEMQGMKNSTNEKRTPLRGSQHPDHSRQSYQRIS
jgi:hypothetical protein